MIFAKICQIFGIFVTISFAACQTTDDTLVPFKSGEDVTEAVLRKIQRSNIFPDDQSLLRRIAYVDTNFGRLNHTYRDGYFGGIWQIDETYFNRTQTSANVQQFYGNISTHFNINWPNVTWNDLLKPLYSGLAARLYLQSLNQQIPGTLQTQAEFWKQYFREGGNVTEFMDLVRALERDPECQGMIDICMVLDASGSIGAAAFVQAKDFAADLVKTFKLGSTRVAFIVYGTLVTVEYDFSNNYTATEMNAKIRGIYYINTRTNTSGALLEAVNIFNATAAREGVPRVVATFTDGANNEGNLATAVNAVKNASLTSFAVGIGSAINYNELQQIALQEAANVFTVSDYDALAGFIYRMNAETCRVPQQPEIGTNQTGNLGKDERRYFKFELTAAGITFTIRGSVSIVGWYSYSEETPNSALYDGVINGITFIPFRSSSRQAGENNGAVFITIQNTAETNTEYTVFTEEGNKVPNSSQTLAAFSICTLFVLSIFSLFLTV